MNRPFLNLVSTGTLVFDGLKAVCWFVQMNSNITAPRFINIAPGQLYTFVFTQNAIGGHIMRWPTNSLNAPPINPAPNSVTVQHFIADMGGTMLANIPPTGAL